MEIGGASFRLAEQEIVSWWSAERGRVDRECRAAAERYKARAFEEIDKLSVKELLIPSAARKSIERRAQSDITVFQRRLARELQLSCEESIAGIEGADAFRPMDVKGAAFLTAGGVLGAGSVGGAVATAALATTSGTVFFGLIAAGGPVIAWPIFAAGAVGALTAATLSPTLLKKSGGVMRKRFGKHLARSIDRALVGDHSKGSAKCTRQVFVKALDDARDQRLTGLGAQC